MGQQYQEMMNLLGNINNTTTNNTQIQTTMVELFLSK